MDLMTIHMGNSGDKTLK